jgi:hydrogenase maturation protein HypF
MELEYLADPNHRAAYPIDLVPPSDLEGLPGAADAPPFELDWRPLVEALLEDSRRGTDPSIIAARFHNSLVESMTAVAREVGESRVALSGGCFQNRRLLVGAADRLREAGFEVLLHRQVPANDGGISLGQVLVASTQFQESAARV